MSWVAIDLGHKRLKKPVRRNNGDSSRRPALTWCGAAV